MVSAARALLAWVVVFLVGVLAPVTGDARTTATTSSTADGTPSTTELHARATERDPAALHLDSPLAAGGAVNPSTIRFSQSSIGRTFSSGGTLRETIEGLTSGAISPEAFPPIRVLERNGLTFTLDNRRLFVFQEAGVPIRTVPATAEEIAAEAWKFTTRNEGASIRVRGGL
jgi:hypothetical protein